jgi:hypothetical protein
VEDSSVQKNVLVLSLSSVVVVVAAEHEVDESMTS